MIKRVQFPNLNGLRFLAAFGVIIHHTEQAKSIYGLPNIWSNYAMSHLGSLCVSLFFVLSGFLITYLLVEESRVFGSISVARFYIRRALRIWPLYFTIFFLGFAILPAIHVYQIPTYPPVWDKILWLKTTLYALFSPHVSEAFFPPIAYAGVLWSVGVEEWFYAVWPWLVNYVRRSRTLFVLLSSIVIVLPIVRSIWSSGCIGFLLIRLQFDCMAIGGLFALLLHAHSNQGRQGLITILYRSDVQLLNYIFVCVALFQGWDFGIANVFIYSVLFGNIILNLAANKQSILNLENSAMRWLGAISYGLYCYNWITIVTAIRLARHFFPHLHSVGTTILTSGLSTILTILAAGISYEMLERRFLLLKRSAYTRIPTIENISIQEVST